MKKRLTVFDLEEMTTHELGDLLGNIALVLKKLPNVPVEQVEAVERPAHEADNIAAGVRREKGSPRRESGKLLPDWLAGEEEE